jgi:hypothetical protein
MAMQHLRSGTANKRPQPTGMSDGQLAININSTSPGVFVKDSGGALVKVGPVHVGTTAPNATPAAGGQSGNSTGELWLDTSLTPAELKTWDGSAWQSATGQEIPVSKLIDGSARQLLQTDAAGTGVEWTSNVDVPGTLDVTGAAVFDSTATVTGVISANGKVSFPLGTEGAPSLYPSSDTNTGLYSPGADQIAISTGGTGRLFIDSAGKVGVGTSSPGAGLHVVSAGQTTSALDTTGDLNYILSDAGNTANNGGSLVFAANSGAWRFAAIKGAVQNGGGNSRGDIVFSTRSTTADAALSEKVRITYDGKLGLGTSSPSDQLTVSSTNNTILSVSTGNSSAKIAVDSNRAANLIGSQIVGRWNGNDVARIDFYNGADGTNKDDGAIALSTSNSGSSPTERMRIKNDGTINFSNVAVYADNAAATSGGLAVGDVYRTSTGQLMIRY